MKVRYAGRVHLSKGWHGGRAVALCGLVVPTAAQASNEALTCALCILRTQQRADRDGRNRREEL